MLNDSSAQAVYAIRFFLSGVSMCRELATLQQSVVCYASSFDAHSLTPAQAAEVARLCALVESSIGSIKALAAARSAEGNDWKDSGFRSAADQLAHQGGISPSLAKRTLKAGQRMSKQPDVAQAALRGELSLEQAEAVSLGAQADPRTTGDLLEKAKRSSLQELHEEVAAVKARASDQEARHKAQHARRSLRRWSDLEGSFQAHLAGVAEDGPRLWRMLDPIRRRLNILRRDTGMGNERLDALDYDALMLMADIAAGRDGELSLTDLVELGLFPQLDPSTATPGNQAATEGADSFCNDVDSRSKPSRRRKKLAGSPARVMIRVDLDALLRGVASEGELSEIAGYGPVPVSVVRDVIVNDNPFLVGILTKGHELVGVYHHGRHPNTYQRSALDFLYPTCAVQGCSAKIGLQYDHRIDWRHTHFTLYDILDRLCPHHHRLKTDHGWSLVEGSGKRAFVPPDDPQHPRNNRDPTTEIRTRVASAPSNREPPTSPTNGGPDSFGERRRL